MQFTQRSQHVNEEQRVHVSVDITADPMPWGNTNARRKWAPIRARGEFYRSRHDGGDWSDWTLSGAIAFGYNVLASGARGADRHERIYGFGDSPLDEIWRYLKTLEPGADLPAAFVLLDCGCPADVVRDTGHQEGCSLAGG